MEVYNGQTRQKGRITSNMDPINIFVGVNFIATFGANLGGAQKGLKSTVSAAKEKPRTYLQKLPLYLSVITLIALILAVFRIGTIDYSESYRTLRLAGLFVYIVFSWIQIWASRKLGSNFSTEVLINKNHQLITEGPFKLIRHPQYLSQFLMDLGAGIATLSYILIPLALIELPFLILRASLEDKLLAKHFSAAFDNYKKKAGFMIPFIG